LQGAPQFEPLFELPEPTAYDEAAFAFERFGEELNRLQNETASEINTTRYLQGAARAGIGIIESLATTGVDDDPRGLIAVAGVEIASEYLNISFENTLNEMRETGAEQANAMLQERLRGDGANELHSALDDISALDGDEAYDKAVSISEGLRDEYLSGIEDVDARDRAGAHFTTMVADAALALAQKERNERIASDQAIQADVTANREALVGISRTLGEYVTQSKKQFEQLEARQTAMQNGLNALNSRVDDVDARLGDLTNDVGFLTEFALGRMTPQEQITALKRGMGSLGPKERQERIEKLEVVRDRLAFQEQAGEWINGANQLVQLAGHFDVDPEFLADAQKAADLATTGLNAYNMVLEGGFTGYVGAANAIMGAFGSKVDAEQARFEAIMNQLVALREGQRQIMENQQRLFEGQRQLIEGQRVIIGKIDSLAVATQRNFGRVFDELATIQASQEDIARAVRAVLESDINESCGDAMSGARLDEYPVTYDYLRYSAPVFDACWSELSGIFASWEAGRGHFSTRDIDFVLSEAAKDFNDKQYGPLRLVLDTLSHGNGAAAFASLLPVPESVNDLSLLNTSRPVTANIEEAYGLIPPEIQPLPEAGLFIQNLLWRIEQLHWAYPMVELYDASSARVFTAEEIDRMRYANRNGRIALRNALRWIEVGIAQENLIAGSIAIPYFYELLKDVDYSSISNEDVRALLESNCHDTSLTKRKTAAVCILSANSLLSQNFLVYAFLKDLDRQEASIPAYAVAHNRTRDDYDLRQLIGETWDLRWSPDGSGCDKAIEGWAVRIGLRCFTLPTADELNEATMHHRPEMDHLLAWKSIIVRSIAEFDLPNALEPEEQRLLSTILLRSEKERQAPRRATFFNLPIGTAGGPDRP
jgi:hypothetical protein